MLCRTPQAAVLSARGLLLIICRIIYRIEHGRGQSRHCSRRRRGRSNPGRGRTQSKLLQRWRIQPARGIEAVPYLEKAALSTDPEIRHFPFGELLNDPSLAKAV